MPKTLMNIDAWKSRIPSLRDDLLAGLTGAVAGAPQAMGFALIAGVSPIYGLYTAVASTIVGALAGASNYVTVGPTNALVLVVGSSLAGLDSEVRIEGLFVLTLLVGAFFLSFGLLRLGFLVRFVSNAVMTGFITGAGLLIIFGQVRHLNGYEPEGATALLRFVDWLLHLPAGQPETMYIGIASILTILLVQRTPLRNLATLVAIVGTSLAVIVLGWDNVVATVADISSVPRGLPLPILPNLSLVPDLVASALAMTVLGAVQSAALTSSIPEPDGTTSDTNRDFLGMGLGNLIGAFFQSMPACGSLSRTAVNIRAGARSRWSNVFAGSFVALFLLFFGPLVETVTLAALAAQLILAAISLLRPHQMLLVWQVNWPARVAMVTTFVSTLVLPLEYSIYVGVLLSLVLYVLTSSQKLYVDLVIPLGDHQYRKQPVPPQFPADDVVILAVHGQLYFAAVRKLESLLPNPAHSQRTIVILRLRDNDYLGSTGIRFLQRYSQALEARGGRLILAGLSKSIRQELDRTGVAQTFGEENLFDETEIYFEATECAYHYAQSLLAADKA
jgi:sulfate permease, SulP family